MALEIDRLTTPDQVIDLAPVLAELQNAGLSDAPHCRPITGEEIAALARSDSRFSERAILLAHQGEEPAGWCHVEPPAVARPAGDLYPYGGGEVVFQPGLPHVAPGPGSAETLRGLLYAACQVRAQQEARHLEVFAPQGSPAEADLRSVGFRTADRWATYVAPVTGGPIGETRLSVTPLREADLEALPATLTALHLLDGEFALADLLRLAASVPGFTPQGLLLARRADVITGYAAVMTDFAYAAATGCDRAWLALGPLGMAVIPGGDRAAWLRTMVRAAAIAAFARRAKELAFVAGLAGKQAAVWAKMGFEVEVRWWRWRADL